MTYDIYTLNLISKTSMLLSCYRQGTIKTIGAQWVYGSRPSQTAYCFKVRDRKWGAGGSSGRLAISKTIYPC